ncbi:MAG: phage baseplate assembly protein V [Pseudomonadota bacterium]
MSRFDHAEADRRIGALIRVGRVEEADYEAATLRVRIGANLTGPIPWLAPRAGGDRVWWAPEIGEQVLVLSVGGEADQAVVLPALYSDAHPAPADSADIWRIEFADGAVIDYDRAAHALRAVLPEGGTAHLEAPGGVTIIGDVQVTGTITASEDVIAQGIRLVTHRHDGVDPGPGLTGEPVG